MPSTPVAQYLRMSTDQQRYSLENQSATIGDYADRHGFEIVKSYVDAGRSGLTTKRRTGLKDLLRDVVAGDAPFSHILVVDVSRWGRFQDADEAAHYEFICREAGVRVLYCAESFRDDLGGAIIKQLRRVMAGEYSRDLSRRVKQGQRRSALSGNAFGRPPFAFRRAAHTLEGDCVQVLKPGERSARPDHAVRWVWGPAQEIETLRLIFRLYVSKRLLPAKIAARLNHEGRLGWGGARWSGGGVTRALTNEMAIGVMAFNKSSCDLGIRSPQHPSSQWIKRTVCPPVVSESMFRRAQARRADLDGRWHTDGEMLHALRRLLARKGRLSQRAINEAPDAPGALLYWKRFGSLREAFRLVGYDEMARLDPRVTTQRRDEIIAGLKRLHRQHGGINAVIINADPRLPSVRSIVSRFGPLRDLYLAAGFTISPKGWQRRRGTISSSCRNSAYDRGKHCALRGR